MVDDRCQLKLKNFFFLVYNIFFRRVYFDVQVFYLLCNFRFFFCWLQRNIFRKISLFNIFESLIDSFHKSNHCRLTSNSQDVPITWNNLPTALFLSFGRAIKTKSKNYIYLFISSFNGRSPIGGWINYEIKIFFFLFCILKKYMVMDEYSYNFRK